MTLREPSAQASGPADAGQRPAAATGVVKRGEPLSSALLAKATLTRLAQARLEPTPENYARAWIEVGGAPPRSKEAPPALRALPLPATQSGLGNRSDLPALFEAANPGVVSIQIGMAAQFN